MPFDPDQYLKEKTQPTGRLQVRVPAGPQFDPDEYLRTHPDPDRGALEKAGEFGTGAQRGVLGDMLGLTRHLPGDYLPGLPESAVQARRGARAEAQKFADAPPASGYETAGKLFGREAPFMAVPGGGRVAAWGVEKGVQALPTLIQLATLLHQPLLALLRHTMVHRIGAGTLHAIADAAAPLLGRTAGAVTRIGEKAGAAELVNQYGRDDETKAPTPAPAATPAVPPPAQPRAAPTAPRPDPRPDADTDAPVANRSGKSDRFQLLGGATN